MSATTTEEKTPAQLEAEKTAATAEAIKQTPQDVINDVFGSPESKPREKNPDEAKKPDAKVEGDEAKKAEAKKPAAAKKPAPKPVEKPETKAEPLTADQVAEAAARGVASAMKKEAPVAADPEKKEKDEPWLSDHDKRTIPILEKMEQMFPDRCKGLADKFRSEAKVVAEYA